MDMTGEYRIAAPRETVWRALNDPEILRQALPGCESLAKLSDTDLTATLGLTIGPVKARFSGKVKLSDIDPPNGYTISGEGQGGVAGFGKGSAKVVLIEDDGVTLLQYTAQASVGGKLAQLGARLIDATAKKLADEFFARFSAIVGQASTRKAPAEVVAEISEAAAAAAMAALPPPSPRLPTALWIAILVAVIGALWWWFARA